MNPVDVVGYVLLAGLLLVSWWVIEESQKRLNDPNDNRTVFLTQLSELAKITGRGRWAVTIFRQSGNVHAAHEVVGDAQEALSTALQTFRRAGIDAVHLPTNGEAEMCFGRLYHDHRGSNEGRKVSRAVIKLVERLPPLTPTPKISNLLIGMTCNCGVRKSITIDELDDIHICSACQVDNTISNEQKSRIRRDIALALEQANERIRAGETSVEIDRRIG